MTEFLTFISCEKLVDKQSNRHKNHRVSVTANITEKENISAVTKPTNNFPIRKERTTSTSKQKQIKEGQRIKGI